ncbi:MAG TPA: hypothetical protein DER33_03940 [Syntrophomonas sp.]|nr:hypothetical protein [Syntrophomonas sp.]
MIPIILFVLVGFILLIFCIPISLRVYNKVNLWADETEIEELKKRIMLGKPKVTLVIVILLGLYWLWVAGLLILGKPVASVEYYSFLIWGLVFLLFNRKLGAINSFWALRYRSMSYPILVGRLNVFVVGVFLLFFAVLW